MRNSTFVNLLDRLYNFRPSTRGGQKFIGIFATLPTQPTIQNEILQRDSNSANCRNPQHPYFHDIESNDRKRRKPPCDVDRRRASARREQALRAIPGQPQSDSSDSAREALHTLRSCGRARRREEIRNHRDWSQMRAQGFTRDYAGSRGRTHPENCCLSETIFTSPRSNQHAHHPGHVERCGLC